MILHEPFIRNFVSEERKKKKERKTKYGKGGTFPSAGTQANERALFTYWDTKRKKESERVVNEERKRVHYDNMQHNIKSFVLLLA